MYIRTRRLKCHDVLKVSINRFGTARIDVDQTSDFVCFMPLFHNDSGKLFYVTVNYVSKG